MNTRPNLSIIGSACIHLFDPVGVLQVHQTITQTRESVPMGLVAPALQVLPDEVEDSGEGSEVVVLLDMEF